MTILPRFAVSRRRSRQAAGRLCMEQRRAMVDPQDSELDELQGGTDDADTTKILLLTAEDSGES